MPLEAPETAQSGRDGFPGVVGQSKTAADGVLGTPDKDDGLSQMIRRGDDSPFLRIKTQAAPRPGESTCCTFGC